MHSADIIVIVIIGLAFLIGMGMGMDSIVRTVGNIFFVLVISLILAFVTYDSIVSLLNQWGAYVPFSNFLVSLGSVFTNPIVLRFVISAILFIIYAVGIKIVTSLLSLIFGALKRSKASIIDRLFGSMFCVALALTVVIIILMTYTQLPADWVTSINNYLQGSELMKMWLAAPIKFA